MYRVYTKNSQFVFLFSWLILCFHFIAIVSHLYFETKKYIVQWILIRAHLGWISAAFHLWVSVKLYFEKQKKTWERNNRKGLWALSNYTSASIHIPLHTYRSTSTVQEWFHECCNFISSALVWQASKKQFQIHSENHVNFSTRVTDCRKSFLSNNIINDYFYAVLKIVWSAQLECLIRTTDASDTCFRLSS